MRNRKILIIIVIFLLAAAGLIIIINVRRKQDGGYVRRAVAYKMLALLEADKNTISNAPDCFDGKGEGAWYEKYYNYMISQEYADTVKNKNGNYTYGEFIDYLEARNLSTDEIKSSAGININKSGKTLIKKKQFDEIYDYLLALWGSDEGMHTEEMIICMTPSNSEEAGRWQTFTDKGSYFFEGLVLDAYIDSRIRVYVRGDEIAGVDVKLSDDIVYSNAWLESGSGNHVTAYIGGAKRIFDTGKLESDFTQTVGDIHMKGGKVKSVALKNSSISGKVLMADTEKIEIEGYGMLSLDENFKVYKTYGSIEEKTIKDVLVGYDTADFVVADGNVCAALISRTVKADNIRVLIMSTGFTSLFHERVSITGTGNYIVSAGGREEEYEAGEITDIYKDSSLLSEGRVSIRPVSQTGRIRVLTVEKSYGNPEYRGTLEVALQDEGLLLINDVLIEEYLYAVVPSEMPNRFGVEALKVQAVCARSYAYRQLLNNSYSRYGAHVDDSVNYQVYNNVQEKEEATEAVRETYGEVASYDGNPITTYYYSTSCGHTSDNSVWGGNPDSCPYLVSETVNPDREETDLSDEETFAEYIRNDNEKDFDYGFGYYRWSVRMSMADITKSVNEYLYSRYCANPSQIMVSENGRWISKEIRNVGTVSSVEITKRSSGGAVMSMIIRGSEATIKVDNELNIRYLLCPHDNPITLFKGDTTTFYILPSAYCILEKYDENDGETGYVIRGGGYGHGIGMSQNAVSNMVKSGMKYNEILEFFFKGSDIMNVYGNE